LLLKVSDIDTGKPMCTVIFENTRFKEENKVLAKIAPAKSPSAKVIDIPNFQQLFLKL
jgi:hypothetical protein